MEPFDAIRKHCPDWPEASQTEAFWGAFCNEAIRRSSANEEVIKKFQSVVVKLAAANIKTILEMAESPIEKIFMTWTYFAFLNYWPFCMAVLNPGVAASLHDYYESKVVIDELAGKEPTGYSAACKVLNQEELGNFLLWELLSPDDAIFVVPQAQLSQQQYPKLQRMRFDYFFFKRCDEKKRLPLIVECDGYEYHKESFIKDRKRDRSIRGSGIEVMRFSGSEIYQNPQKVSLDILDYWKD